MKKLIGLLMLVSVGASASPYVRPFDPVDIHQSAGCGFDTTGNAPMACTTDTAVLTHDTADGSIIPWQWQPLLPPEDWALSFGGGGDLHGEAVINGSLTANVAPQIASLLFKGVSTTSPQWEQGVKTFVDGSGNVSLRLGVGFYGDFVKQGHFQSASATFPGKGFGDILNRAKRAEVGLAWKFGKKQ